MTIRKPLRRIFSLSNSIILPAKNIHYAADATLNDMRMQLQWLQKVQLE